MLIPGEQLLPPPRGKSRVATVLGSGSIRVDGIEFLTPSAVAKKVSGNSAEPGWEFWSVDREGQRLTLFELRARLRASRKT